MNDALLDLARYGQPMLSLLNAKKWWCKVDMRINITGATFKVEGEGTTPESAVLACQKNMLAALAQLAAIKKPALKIAS